MNTQPTVNVNGTDYRWPLRPVVVVCIDGGDPAYLQRFLADATTPNIARFVKEGYAAVIDGSMPSFTCPNNMSIITGTPTSKHGISGNFYLDTSSWEPVVMTGPELLRGDTIVTRFAEAGAKVVSITAKDKLRKQLSKGLDVSQGHVSFSSEYADRCTLAENGIENVLPWLGMEQPGMYSMELSLLVLEAGIKLLRERRPELLYLSLTDWVQHKWAPDEDGARDFYRKLDDCIGRLAALDATVALTADHGMNDKSNEAGEPKVHLAAGHPRRRVRRRRDHRDLPDHRCLRRTPRCARRFRARVVARPGDGAADHRPHPRHRRHRTGAGP